MASLCGLVEMSAISVSNAIDTAQQETREQRYLAVVKRYSTDELQCFPHMLSELVLALEDDFDDVLGRAFHDLELQNKYTGQFFTPYDLCRLIAEMTSDPDEMRARIAERGFVTVMEPACGGGAMIIAFAEAMKRKEINYQTYLHVHAVDVDLQCVYMSYVQFALLGIPAVVIHGNTLTLKEYSHWYTPAHILGNWRMKLRIADAAQEIVRSVVQPSAEPIEDVPTTVLDAPPQLELGILK